MKKKIVLSMAALAIVAALVFVAGRREATHVLAQVAIHVQPWTVDQVTTSWMNNPVGEIIERRTIARRSDGSEGMLSNSPHFPGTARRVDLMDGHQGAFLDFLAAKMTGRNPAAQIAARKQYLENPPFNCIQPNDLLEGNETLNNVETFKLTHTVGAGTAQPMTITEWRSPKMSCFALKFVIAKQSDGTRISESDTSLVQFGEPSPIMFDTGSTYKEMSPTQLRQTLYSSMGVTESMCPQCYMSNNDDAVYSQRQQP
jgi:hypothetical protein